MTYTYALLPVSEACYREIRDKLQDAGYSHAFHSHEGDETPVIDMHGIGLTIAGPGVEPMTRTPEQEAAAKPTQPADVAAHATSPDQ